MKTPEDPRKAPDNLPPGEITPTQKNHFRAVVTSVIGDISADPSTGILMRSFPGEKFSVFVSIPNPHRVIPNDLDPNNKYEVEVDNFVGRTANGRIAVIEQTYGLDGNDNEMYYLERKRERTPHPKKIQPGLALMPAVDDKEIEEGLQRILASRGQDRHMSQGRYNEAMLLLSLLGGNIEVL
jgi:hypothetical protein